MSVVEQVVDTQKWIECPVFILGHPKSGTSLLVGILDNHPELLVLPEETDYFDVLYELAKVLSKNTQKTKAEKIDIICETICNDTHLKNFFRGSSVDDISGNFDYEKFDANGFKNSIKTYLNKHDVSPKTVFEALPYAFHAVSELHYTDIKSWVEKTPYRYGKMRLRHVILDKMYEQFKIVHIFRDPRDNYLAYKKKWQNLTVTGFCYEWKKVYDIARSLEGHTNHFSVRYEDLVGKPDEVILELTNFLGIERVQTLETPSKYGNAWYGNSMFGEKHKGINNKYLGRFRSLTDQTDTARIEYLLKEPMIKMGYQPEVPSVGGGERIFLSVAYWFKYIGRMFEYVGTRLKEKISLIRIYKI